MSGVELRNVSRRFGEVVALDDVSLVVADGELFGLLGPSGSGKTTLLRAVAGLETLDNGTLLIGAEDVQGVPVHRRDIAMVFQSYALFPHLSVFDNVAFGLSVRGNKTGEIRQRVEEALSLVELSGLDKRRPHQLSGGQRQRVALARALVTRPKVLLLDEPLGALDKRLRQQMQIELRELQRRLVITTIFVTHDQEEALSICDRIALFDNGRVVQVGAPDEVYEQPRTVFAAGFLGAANFFSGQVVERREGRLRVRLHDGQSMLIPDTVLEPANTITLAVRPEKMSLGPAATKGCAENQLSATVMRRVYAGSSITYHLNVGEQAVTVFEQNRGGTVYDIGDEVYVTWPAGDCAVVQA